MSLAAWELALALLAPLWLGTGLLRALDLRARDGALVWLGASWAGGLFALAGLLYAWMWTGLPLERAFLAPAVALAGAGLHLVGRDRGGAGSPGSADAPFATWERAAFAVAVAIALGITAQRAATSNFEVVSLGDEASIWTNKAKLCFHEGAFDEGFAERAGTYAASAHLDYPLLDPLAQTWVYVCAGEIVGWENRLPLQLAVAALLLAAAGALRRVARPGVAALLVLTLATLHDTFVQTREALADALVAFGVLLALEGWMRWRGTGERRWWRLHALGLGVAVAAKNDGLFYLASILTAHGLAFAWGRVSGDGARTGDRLRRAAWLGLPLAVAACTWVLNARFGFRNDLASGAHAGVPPWEILFTELGDRLGPVLAFVWGGLVLESPTALHPDPVRTANLPLLFALLCLASPRAALGAGLRGPTLAIALFLAGHVVIYLATPQELHWHLATSAGRVVFQSLFATALWIGAAGAATWPALSASAAGARAACAAPAGRRSG